MTQNMARNQTPIGLGIAGLGMAGAVMVQAAAAHPGYVLKAAADPHPGPREAFARDFNARAYADVARAGGRSRGRGGLHRDPAPVPRAARVLAAEHGKHIILEKPMALTLADCDAIIAAVERHKVHLIVGHTHAFDPAVRLMRDIIARGELGRLGMINSFNYTNFLYRPRRPEELDTAKGGGILFNQVPHQIDTARLLAGGLVRSVRAQASVLDPARPTEGELRGAAAVRQRRRGLAGLQRLRPFRFRRMALRHQRARRAETDRAWRRAPRAGEGAGRDEGAHRDLRLRLAASALPPHQPHFGITIVTCADGDMRASADGVTIYDRDGMRELPIPRGGSMPGRREVLDDMRAAIRSGRRPCTTAAGARPRSRSRSRSCARRARAARSCWNIRWRWTVRRG